MSDEIAKISKELADRSRDFYNELGEQGNMVLYASEIDASIRVIAEAVRQEAAREMLEKVNFEVDALVGCCQKCGKMTDLDVLVDDEFWKRVVPKEWKLGVLCPKCISYLAICNGENLHDHIEVMYFSRDGKTTPLLPVRKE